MNKQDKTDLLVAEYEVSITEFYDKFVGLHNVSLDSWYHIESENIRIMANLLNVPQNLLTAIVAVTSPLCRWNNNIQWACDIVRHKQGDKDANPFQGIKGNAYKAFELYDLWANSGNFTDENAEKYLKVKTGCFYHNLLYPSQSLKFTVDVWMFRIAIREWQSPTNSFKLSTLEQSAIRQAYANVYAKLGLHSVGVMPHQLQAALWVKIKDVNIARQWFVDFESIDRFV